MSAALTILLLTIAERDVADPFTSAVARATREALGGETQVVARSLPALPSDADAAALGNVVHADAVVELSWSSTEHLHATIHLRRSASARWVDREMGFWPADDPTERSRTIGFTVASMMPERFNESAAPPPARPEAQPPTSDEGARSTQHEKAPLPHASAITGTFVAGLGVRDSGGGIGGALDMQTRLGRALSLRLGGGALAGQDGPAQVTTHFFYGAVGMAWDGWTTQNARGAVGLRLDALAVRADFSHPSSTTGETDHQGKWMPGADLMVEASYYVSHGLAFVLGAGAGVVFGRTDILVSGQRLTTLQPARPLLEVGIRAGF